jgi:multimeric flavodoxin WrbA
MNKITIISGSHRKDSQSKKISNVLAAKLAEMDNCEATDYLDLAELGLPFWSESYSNEEQALLDDVAARLEASDGFIVVCPEWHGMVPSVLKNFFLLYTSQQFAHKPALIVTVSAGVGGSYPINELRISSYKNSRLCYLPEHLIVRSVGSIFNDKEDDDKRSEGYISKRADACLGILLAYSDALRKAREVMPDMRDFPNGM